LVLVDVLDICAEIVLLRRVFILLVFLVFLIFLIFLVG